VAVAAALQAGATGAVKTVKMTTKLVATEQRAAAIEPSAPERI
jgi:hypothetical protein